MKKILHTILDHVIGILAAIVLYSFLIVFNMITAITGLFKCKKKPKVEDKKMYFNDPFENAWFMQKKKRFN